MLAYSIINKLKMKKSIIFLIAITISLLTFAQDHKSKTTAKTNSKQQVKYTCSMHPEVVSNKLGKCPKCGMDLIEIKDKPKAKEKLNHKEH